MKPQTQTQERSYRHDILDDMVEKLEDRTKTLMPYENEIAQSAKQIMVSEVFRSLLYWLRIIEEVYIEMEEMEESKIQLNNELKKV